MALGARVLGFVPPQWDDVVAFAKAQDPRWTNEDDIRACYWAAYQARVKRWNTAKLANGSTEALAGAVLKYTGWAKGLNGVFKDLEPGEWIWSHETGNYLTAGSEGNTPHLGTVSATTSSSGAAGWAHRRLTCKTATACSKRSVLSSVL